MMRRTLYLFYTALGTGCSFAANGLDDAQTRDGQPGDAARDAAALDARVVDAAGDAPRAFDVTTCPSNYVAINSVTSARYRAAATGVSVQWGAAAQACEADSAGLTHLLVFDSQAEYNAVVPMLQAAHNYNHSWTGAYSYFEGVLLRTRTVTGQSVAALNPGKYSFGQELLRSPRAGFLLGTDFRYSDNPLDYSYNYICECDSRPGEQQPP
ncbi:MAG TPA: hypothetical protein PLF40_29235 [Kofleriaceae bacterium]|nr:hypothetical protein [Kofleriaceae bacterium]